MRILTYLQVTLESKRINTEKLNNIEKFKNET